MTRSLPSRLASLALAMLLASPDAGAQFALAADIRPGSALSYVDDLFAAGGVVYFNANDGTNGAELWSYDPATGAAALLADINPGSGSSGAYQFVEAGGKVYFVANEPTNGYELWSYDPATGAVALAADINPGPAGSLPRYFVEAGGKLYFNAKDGTNGAELWSYDPATGAAALLADINPGSEASNPHNFMETGGKVYFSAYRPTNGFELWSYDPATGTAALAASIRPGTASSHQSTAVVEGKLFFSGGSDGELWSYDPATGTAALVADINPGGASWPQFYLEAGGKLYFDADDGANGRELWSYDPATGAAALLADINTGSEGSNPSYYTEARGVVYFNANDGTNGAELWSYDPATGAVALAADIRPGLDGSNPKYLVEAGGGVYFSASELTYGLELWSYAVPTPVPEWTAELAAGDHDAGTVGGTHRDGGNVVGMAGGATDGLDADLDAPEPGASTGDHVQLYVQGPGTDATFGDRYMRQVVAVQDLSAATYDFTLVVSASGYDGEEVAVEAEDLAAFPDTYRLVVVDGTVRHDLADGPYAFTYDGAKTLALRVGALPAPSLPAGSDAAGLPASGSTLAAGQGVTLTWDPDLEGAAEVLVQISRDGGLTWETVVAGIDPSTGSYVFTPGSDLVGADVLVRTVARNALGDELELGRVTVDVDYGTPGTTFDDGEGAGALSVDLTVGTAVPVPFAVTNAETAALYYSADGGATWTLIAGPLSNPNGDLSQLWTGTFAEWTPGVNDVSYGGLFKAVMTVPRSDGTTEAVEVLSDPLTVVPDALGFALAAGFQMASLPLDAGAQTPAEVFVDGTSGVAVSPLFLYTYHPPTFYTLLDNAASTFTTGRGFWAGSSAVTSGTVTGTPLRSAGTVALDVAGSHMVGVPFALPVTAAELSLTLGPETKTYADALAAGWIAAGLYTWDGDAYTDAAAGELAPWRSYWLPALVDGLSVTVAPKVPTAPSDDRLADGAEPEWALAVTVEHAGGGADRTTALGLHADALVGYDRFDQPEPPAPPTAGAVRAYAARPEWGGAFSAYDREAQPALAGGESREWPLVIEAPAGAVTVTWSVAGSEAAPLAAGLSFELVDDVAGVRERISDGGTYAFESDGSARPLTVALASSDAVSAEGPALPVAFAASLAPNPARGSAHVALSAPEAGDVAVGVYDALGRRVADVRQTVAAGSARIALPVSGLAPGVYVIRVVGPGGVATRQLTVAR